MFLHALLSFLVVGFGGQDPGPRVPRYGFRVLGFDYTALCFWFIVNFKGLDAGVQAILQDIRRHLR